MAMPLDGNEDAGYLSDASSAPNSENFFEEDGQPPEIELTQLEDDDYMNPIPVIIHLAPPAIPDGPPILEVWGARPFGYSGETVIWTLFRAEPESDEVPDDASFWAPLGIQLDHEAYYRAWLVRPTEETFDNPPPAPGPLDIFYVRPENQVQPVPGALLVKTFIWHPEHPARSFGMDTHTISTFWLLGCGKVTDRKDLKRIHMKVDVYLYSIKHVGCRHGTFDDDDDDEQMEEQ
ncbi:hypothetical protein FS837_002474 [Tulasnella sp. UAMH 9824]|nr:hypothetical protein FS837_002474 [Tulasnella sp. UAMH 9824]